jgi:outer membrane protein
MKTIFKTLFLATALCASAWTGLAQAQDFKVGIVNTDRILRDSNVAKTAQAKLESEFLKREKDLNEAINGFKAAAERFERDAPIAGISPAEVAAALNGAANAVAADVADWVGA